MLENFLLEMMVALCLRMEYYDKRTFCENQLECGNGVSVLSSQTMRTLILNTKYKIVICLQ